MLFVGALLAGVGAGPAVASAPWWHLASSSDPGVLAPGGEGTIAARVVNMGDGATSGAITVTDTLPVGVTAQGVSFSVSPLFGNFDLAGAGLVSCETQPGGVQCEYPEGFPVVSPYEVIEMRVAVKIDANATSASRTGWT